MTATLDQAAADPQQTIAKLQRQLDEALAREAATAEVLQVINSSPDELAPVFDAMLEKALALCGASFGMMNTYDGEQFHAAAVRGVPEALAEFRRRNPLVFVPGTPPALILAGESVVHRRDVMDEESYRDGNPFTRALVNLGGARTLLVVALRKDETLLGTLSVYRQEVRTFSDKEIALLQNFAAQAVIAMENARLLGETREALDQQTATAEVLGVINSSPGDLAPVFDAILQKAHALCGAASGGLIIIEHEQYRAVAVHGEPNLAEYWLQLGWIRFPTGEDTLFARLRRGELIHIPDVSVDDGNRKSEQYHRLIELSGARSLILVPLRKDDVLFGAITAFRKELRPFSDKQIALLQSFAAQAVIAMENARLITETREALEQQTATAEVLQVINSSPGDLAPVFDAVLAKTLRLCEAAHGHLLTCDGDVFHPAAVYGENRFAEHWRQQGSIRPAEGNPLARLLRGERVVHIADAREDDAYRNVPAYRQVIDLGGIRTSLIVPLRKDSVLLGAVRVYRREVRPFNDKQIALVENFAAQAVIAMENARLITETQEALDQQTATAEVLGVINSSPGDLTPVFESILEKAHALCGAAYGGLLSYDGDAFHVVAAHGEPRFVEAWRQGPIRPPEGTPLARVMYGERSIQIVDAVAEDSYRNAPAYARLIDLSGVRTFLMVPLRRDDALLGVITVFRREVRPFSGNQIALLENFAAQAVIAMENARLITETREALEQQTATAEVLQVINSSPGDLAPVFDAMLEKATTLCEASFGVLWTYDGENMHASAVTGVPQQFAEFLRQGPHRPARTVQQDLLSGEHFEHIADLTLTDGYRSGETLPRAGADLGGVRTLLAVPLRKDDKVLGVFGIYRQEVRPFSDKQIALLQNFAAQAVIAMENARLITETREALAQQTATAEVLGVINSSPGDLAPVFDAILEKAHALCGAVVGSLVTFDGERFRFVAAHGIPKPLADSMREPYLQHPNNPMMQLTRGEPLVHVIDFAEYAAQSPADLIARNVVELAGARTFLAVPLCKDGEFLGAITAYRREVRPFSEKEIALLQNFAAQAVIAIENARLITETREALEQQTATAEVLGVINSSPGDLAPVFDAILEKARALCGAAHGSLSLYDGERFRAVAVNSPSEGFAERLRTGVPGSDTPLLRPLLDGARFVHTRDLAEIDHPQARAAVELTGAHTALFVPLRKDDVLLGLISAVRIEVRPFSDKEIALVENFAAQAVIAMENARLLGELRARTDEIAGWNRELEVRVAAQLAEIERTGKLRRFLAPQLADLILAQSDESILESHRREIVVVFCDLRGFTGFAERAEPEEVMALLRDYHAAMGPIVARFEGTIDHYGGDGIMVFFNDPLPTPDPARRAIDMAVAMRQAAQDLLRSWRRHGHDIGFGVGISQGYATLGQIGFAERMDYTAIGTVTNLAARLCAEAKDGQILVSSHVATAIEDSAQLEEIGDLSLKGLSQAVAVYNVVAVGAQASAS